MEENAKKKQRWWTAAHDKARERAVFSTYRALDEQNKVRAADNLHYARLYGTRNIEGFSAHNYSRASRGSSESLLSRKPKLAYNLVQSVVDTVHSKIAKNTPRAMYLTDGGSWSQRINARKLTKFADGLAYESDLHNIEQRLVKDAAVFGDGAALVYESEGRVAVERVMGDEILIDESEALYAQPRQMYRRKWVQRDHLMEMFSDASKEVRAALAQAGRTGTGDYALSSDGENDMILVVEAWHLRSGKDADDGRHVICVDTATLEDEEYEDDEFPLEFIPYAPRLVGFWSQGIAERLEAIQYDLNKTFAKIENAMDHATVTRVFKRRGANIPNSHIRNRNLNGVDIIEVDDMRDIVISAPNAVPPELWNHVETQIRRGFEQEGVSPLDAASRKPAGLDSGKALRDFNDITTERFILFGQALERFRLGITRRGMKLAKRIAESEGENGKKNGYKVRTPSKWKADAVDLADLDLPEDGYILKAYPVSALPTTPAAKRQEVAEWAGQGWIGDGQPNSPETIAEARRLLDFPDLDDSNGLVTSDLDVVDAALSKMLEDGEYVSPEPFQNLAFAMKRAQRAYLRARNDGCPEEHLALVREYMQAIKDMLTPPVKPAPAGPPAPQMAPPMPVDPMQSNPAAPMPPLQAAGVGMQ